MAASRWDRVKQIFSAALEHAPGERARFVADACGTDAELRAEVESLLAASTRGGVLSTPSDIGAPNAAAKVPLVAAHISALAAAVADRYVLGHELGRGGMATVYLAHDLKLGRDVALKVLRPELAALLGTERFLSEVRITARLHHSHILTLIDSGSAGGLLYYVLPYVHGESLRTLLNREHQLSLEQALAITKQVGSALEYAHRKGIVHRDIKPENILFQEGEAMLADFGIALAVQESAGNRLTETGLSLGTPQYMSPEQATGDRNVDARSDLYSLASVLYEMLVGEPPLTGNSVQVVIAKLMTETPIRIRALRNTVPEHVDATVAKALSKVPADRFATVPDFLGALSGGGTPAFTRTVRRVPAPRRLALATAAVLVVAATAWAILQLTSRRDAPVPASVAVLPFENVGGDSTQEYFSAGMADDIANALVNDGVRVAPRASAMAFRGKRPTAREVGSALAVDAVLTGTVSRLRNHLRVTAELADARAGVVLASFSSQDRDTSDLFAVQRAVTDSILRVLRVSLRRDQPRPARHIEEDPIAHDLVMRGRYLADLATGDALTKAIGMFNRALERDSTTVSAYVGLAYVYYILCDAFVSPIEAYPKAKAALDHAMRIDSTRGDVWAMAAQTTVYEWDWPKMHREIERARALNADETLLLFGEASYELLRGDRKRGVSRALAWTRIDPLNVAPQVMLEIQYLFNQQYDSTIAVARRVERMQPGFAYLDSFAGYALGYERRFAEADSAFKAAEPALGHRSPGLAWSLALQGKQAEARAVLDAIERDWKTTYVVPEMVAWAYDALGDRARMYTWLERGIEVHSWWAGIGTRWPAFEKLLAEERYRAVLRRVNLPEDGTR